MCQPLVGECQACEGPWVGVMPLADPVSEQTPFPKANGVFCTLRHKWELTRFDGSGRQKPVNPIASSEPGAGLGGHKEEPVTQRCHICLPQRRRQNWLLDCAW